MSRRTICPNMIWCKAGENWNLWWKYAIKFIPKNQIKIFLKFFKKNVAFWKTVCYNTYRGFRAGCIIDT